MTRIEDLIVLERKMINAKYNKKKIRYWYYKKKYERLRDKVWK